MVINELVNISSRAWALDILAQLHQREMGRVMALQKPVGAGRTALSQSLKHLETLGFIARNPGHGHPLRPEYCLTTKGKHFALIAHQTLSSVPDLTTHQVLRRNWNLPILALTNKPQYFSSLRQSLVPITDRALSSSLQQLEAQKWLKRDIIGSRPPRPLYQSIGAGAKISEILQKA